MNTIRMGKSCKDIDVSNIETISIFSGGNYMCAYVAHVDLAASTDKAVKVSKDNRFAWFPKAALVNPSYIDTTGPTHISVDLASWFEMNKFQQALFEFIAAKCLK